EDSWSAVVDDVAHGLDGDGATDVLGQQRGHPGERLLRRPGRVGGQQDPVAAAQRAVSRQRLDLVHVERSAGEVPALDGVEHGQLVDDPAAAGTHHDGAGGQRGEALGREEAARLDTEGDHVDQDVARGDQVVEVAVG